MVNDLEAWYDREGVDFLEKIGIKKGYTVLDFGCGRGHYTIPASKLVGNIGMVYALDSNQVALNDLEKVVEKKGIGNVESIDSIKDFSLVNEAVDVALCYDVLHYMDFSERKVVYSDIHRVLRKNALFSVYPKHSKGNLPSGELADVAIREIVGEVESVGFVIFEEAKRKLLHDGRFEKGLILNFRKGE
jgi:ubiquinone/menaquinone biosynthesis C-methylase UbiE